MNEQETVADIIAEMRSDANADEYTPDGILGQTLNCLADRLEAAHRRERGNSAALREAPKDIVRLVEQIRLLYSDFPHEIHDIARKARAARAAPPRQCDVGTAQEQAERLHCFCISQDCATCPCNVGKADGRCEFVWMQMPYEEGGNDGH